MYICICNAITDRQIVAAAEQGARSPDDLAHGLGVGLGCGRCTSCAITLLQETVAALTGGPGDGASPIREGAQ
jgi:bacterioferritin-associated ferredoxin